VCGRLLTAYATTLSVIYFNDSAMTEPLVNIELEKKSEEEIVVLYSSAPVSTGNTFKDLLRIIPNAIYNVILV
jgi:hypothetical protein